MSDAAQQLQRLGMLRQVEGLDVACTALAPELATAFGGLEGCAPSEDGLSSASDCVQLTGAFEEQCSKLTGCARATSEKPQMPPPPPHPPTPPPSSITVYQVRVELIAQGTVADVTSDKKAAIVRAFATTAQVVESAIAVTVQAASVLISVVISSTTQSSAAAVESALAAKLVDSAAATEFLAAAAIVVTSPPVLTSYTETVRVTPSLSDSSDEQSADTNGPGVVPDLGVVIFVAIGSAAAVVILAVLVIGLVIYPRRRAMRRAARLETARRASRFELPTSGPSARDEWTQPRVPSTAAQDETTHSLLVIHDEFVASSGRAHEVTAADANAGPSSDADAGKVPVPVRALEAAADANAGPSSDADAGTVPVGALQAAADANAGPSSDTDAGKVPVPVRALQAAADANAGPSSDTDAGKVKRGALPEVVVTVVEDEVTDWREVVSDEEHTDEPMLRQQEEDAPTESNVDQGYALLVSSISSWEQSSPRGSLRSSAFSSEATRFTCTTRYSSFTESARAQAEWLDAEVKRTTARAQSPAGSDTDEEEAWKKEEEEPSDT